MLEQIILGIIAVSISSLEELAYPVLVLFGNRFVHRHEIHVDLRASDQNRFAEGVKHRLERHLIRASSDGLCEILIGERF